MKSPPTQMRDLVAWDLTEALIQGKDAGEGASLAVAGE